MADYPTRLVHEHRLFDGKRVLIRPVREDDETLERAFLSDLSGDSRYLRFQEWVKVPSDNVKTLQPSRPQRPEHRASSATVP